MNRNLLKVMMMACAFYLIGCQKNRIADEAILCWILPAESDRENDFYSELESLGYSNINYVKETSPGHVIVQGKEPEEIAAILIRGPYSFGDTLAVYDDSLIDRVIIIVNKYHDNSVMECSEVEGFRYPIIRG